MKFCKRVRGNSRVKSSTPERPEAALISNLKNKRMNLLQLMDEMISDPSIFTISCEGDTISLHNPERKDGRTPHFKKNGEIYHPTNDDIFNKTWKVDA